MNDYWQLFFVAIAGLGLGGFFYGGLYFTVIRGLNSQHPVLWFVSSLVLRVSLVVVGLYFISNGQWQRIIACLSGFMVAGLLIKVSKSTQPVISKEPHAS